MANAMCKTDKGTLCGWNYGNRERDSNTNLKGIAVGFYADSALMLLEYDETKKKLYVSIDKKQLRENGIEIVDWNKLMKGELA